MSPSQVPGGPFKGFTPHAGVATPAPKQVRKAAPTASAAKRGGGGSNTLSVVALILSIVGLGCAPVGIGGAICGIVAMRLGRNGLALASIIIGSLGTLMWAGFLALAGTGAFKPVDQTVTFGEATDPTNPAFVRAPTMAEAVRFTEMGAGEVARVVYSFREKHQRMPNDVAEATAGYFSGRLADGWGTDFALTTAEGLAGSPNAGETIVFVWSAGPDRTWDTADDFVASSSPFVSAEEYGYKTRP